MGVSPMHCLVAALECMGRMPMPPLKHMPHCNPCSFRAHPASDLYASLQPMGRFVGARFNPNCWSLIMKRVLQSSISQSKAACFEGLETRILFAKAPLFKVVNFVSNDTSHVDAVTADPNLVNGWGLSNGPGTEQWVTNNGTGKVTLYDGNGVVDPLVVAVPGAGGAGQSLPTGQVYNGTSAFEVSPGKPAQFIFATEDGTISAWAPNQADLTKAVIKIDNSNNGATYRGLATTTFNGQEFLLATNDGTGKIDVFDKNFQPAHLNGSFKDAKIPANYEPFGIQNVNGLVYVTYALKSIYEGNTPEGAGYLDVFLPDGSLDHRLVKRGTLNSPWGVARIPGGFGKFKRDIAVGNFGDGKIQVFDPLTGEFRGFFKKAKTGKVIKIDGLWGLAFGNDGPAGSIKDLYFTAGPNEETDGLFGKISIASAPTTQATDPAPTDPGYIYPMARVQIAAASQPSSSDSQSSNSDVIDQTCEHKTDTSDSTV
jgi:uncharacterized protein (TIGR03118 family)